MRVSGILLSPSGLSLTDRWWNSDSPIKVGVFNVFIPQTGGGGGGRDSQNRVLITFIYVLLETLGKNGTNNSRTVKLDQPGVN